MRSLANYSSCYLTNMHIFHVYKYISKIPACYHLIFSVTQKEDIKERGKDKDFFLYHLSPQNGIFLPFCRQGKEFLVCNNITLSCTFILYQT